ncbi:HEPN domain-containing protein [Bradyrhizobium sp. WSM4349]|uniref:HEPN domain-containing protein n=1 Tax=Bradyrhizobium sp. WSM4349 TaxID=1040988 RepID=UPI00035C80E2|nr:HEPN domain-containing protein [Bradyrhizobium sp. WSM4349]
MATDIETFYASHKAVVDFLIANQQPSFASDTNNNFRRSLILAIASSFEHVITGIVAEIPHVHAQGNPMMVGLIEQKVIPRQYHTYFDWDKKNANKFFAMFGAEYAELAKARVAADATLDQAVKDFLALGDTRNRLVHLDYVNFDIEKSPDDIIAMYHSARRFVAFLRDTLLRTPERSAEAGPAVIG